MSREKPQMSPPRATAIMLTSLARLKITEDLGQGLEILPRLYLTNDRDRIAGLITPHFQRIVGVLEAETILDPSRSLLFAFGDVPLAELPHSTFLDHLNSFLFTARFFLLSLWLIKDNSVDFDLGFLEVPHKADPSRISSNFLAVACRAADGSVSSVSFSRTELEKAAQILSEHVVGYLLAGINPSEPYRLRRLQRAFFLLQVARYHENLGLRIASYCMCLEALFSTSVAELAHKLSERVAYFVGKDSDHRANIYSDMKDAYGIRSTILHGDVLSKRAYKKLEPVAKFCDNTLLEVLLSVLSSQELRKLFDSSTEKLERYLNDLTLGRSHPPRASKP